MVRFAYTILYVPDVEKSMSFYERAFGLRRKFIAPGNVYGELITGETTLSFAESGLAKSNLKDGYIESNINNRPFAIEIGFSSDDVAGTFRKAIDEGAVAEAAPQLKPHGQTVAYIRDPDGFLVKICSPM